VSEESAVNLIYLVDRVKSYKMSSELAANFVEKFLHFFEKFFTSHQSALRSCHIVDSVKS